MAKELALIPEDYEAFVGELKERIRFAQVKAALSVNRELILLYWMIGQDILSRQKKQGWGAKIIDRLAVDLGQAFPEVTGFRARNLRYMRTLAEAYPDSEFVQQVVALLPWGHNVRLLDSVKDPDERAWYLRQAIQNGWSRNVLIHQIAGGLYQRQGKALTNFSRTLPAPQSELALQLIKDPYNFDFLTLGPELDERTLERALIEHVRAFILELGKGFALVGSQQHLEVAGQDFFMDLLFYHLRLRCYVVIDLKIGDFKPEFAGKMNFYLGAVDEQLRHPDDGPSIGIILCNGRNEVIVEYALRDMKKPMGVARYQLTHGHALPEGLQGQLPTIEEIMKLLKGNQIAKSWLGTPENVETRMFEVTGMPAGKKALLQLRRNGRWRIWYSALGNHEDWRGDFSSEEEALESLASEVDLDYRLGTKRSN